MISDMDCGGLTPLWTAAARRRFGLRRLDAPSWKNAGSSPGSRKAMSSHRTPKRLTGQVKAALIAQIHSIKKTPTEAGYTRFDTEKNERHHADKFWALALAIHELDDTNTLRNLSELEATKTLIESFTQAINALTVRDKGNALVRDHIKLRETRPFVAKDQSYILPKRSPFNKIIADNHFELLFARFLDDCEEVVSFAKNYFAVNFRLDYVKSGGDISNYYPDFLVKLSDREVYIVETKGREELDLPLKMKRLRQWCDDINSAQAQVKYGFVYVDEESFMIYRPTSFRQLVDSFTEYKKG
jgi:hypothetical protein